MIFLNLLFSLHTGPFLTAVKLEHILCTSTDFHNVLSRSSSDRYWDTTLGRQEAGQDALCHFSFSICAAATRIDLAAGIQFAEIKLCSIPHLKAAVDSDFFFFLCTKMFVEVLQELLCCLMWLTLYSSRLSKCFVHCHSWQQ